MMNKTDNMKEYIMLYDFFQMNIDFKVYIFLDIKSIVNLQLVSKSIYEVFQKKYLTCYYKQLMPDFDKNSKLITNIWKTLMN